MRDLDQKAGAIARVVLLQPHAPRGSCWPSAVIPSLDDLMRFASFQIDDEPHGAAIVFVIRVIETLGGGGADCTF